MSSILDPTLTSAHAQQVAWDQAIAQLVIATFDTELKESLANTAHDVDDHNICLARVSFYEPDKPELILAAYSSSSVLGTKRGTHFGFQGCICADVDKVPMEYACKGMGRHHTEPKLVNAITQDSSIWLYRIGQRTIKNVTIVSQIDVCGSCRAHTLTVFQAALEQRGASLTVYSLKKNPGIGQTCQYTLDELKV